MTVRSKIDSEITKRVGSWFTVRELQSKLRVSNSTLKPLIMRYARDQILRRRRVKGVARAVEFSPAARNIKEFQSIMDQYMPYKAKGTKRNAAAKTNTTAKKGATRSAAKKGTANRTAASKKRATKKVAAKKPAATKKTAKKGAKKTSKRR